MIYVIAGARLSMAAAEVAEVRAKLSKYKFCTSGPLKPIEPFHINES